MLYQLPELAILCVFDHLPIADIGRTVESYPQLGLLGSIALRRRKYLNFESENYSPKSLFHHLKLHSNSALNSLDQRFMSNCDWLLNTFPRVTSLNIKLEKITMKSFLTQICCLIDLWSDKLVNLKMSLSFLDQNGSIAKLVNSLNRLSVVRNLELDLPNLTIENKTIELPVLSRLENFYFRSKNNDSLIFDSLIRYAQPNSHLHQIGIDLECGDVQKFMDQFSNEFCSKFIHLNMLDNLDLSELNNFASKFRSLVHISTEDLFNPLGLLDADNSFHQLVSQLSPLNNLTQLQMTLILNPELSNTNQLLQLPQLHSVKNFELTITGQSHHQLLESLQLDKVFPNLVNLKLKYKSVSCEECCYNDFDFRSEELHKCIRTQLKPVKLCLKLRTIETEMFAFRFQSWLKWSWDMDTLLYNV